MSKPLHTIKHIIGRLDTVTPRTTAKSPDELLGELFQDVQAQRVYRDGITFVDLVPAVRLKKLLDLYEIRRQTPGFNLHAFVDQHFHQYLIQTPTYHTDPNHTIEEHINELWDLLTRETLDSKSALLPVPYPYIVPGGRFRALYYWDTYFTMLGLAAAGKWDLIEGIMKDYVYLIRKFGYIPNASTTYQASRSQAPYFAMMVDLVGSKKGRKRTLARYLPQLRKEYHFWMEGVDRLEGNQLAYRRVAKMPDGEILNRYYDNKSTPRPEMYLEDIKTSAAARDRRPSQVYADLRAAAESAWDFSARWFADEKHISTIQTTNIIPVDLNCLLAYLELSIAHGYEAVLQSHLAEKYHQRAIRRIAAIQKYCWDEKEGFYFDYDFTAQKRTNVYSLAAVWPLFTGITTQECAERVAAKLERDFLKKGGLVSTLSKTGQQWDYPNGWAPLEWASIKGLRLYGLNRLANEIKRRWVATNELTFQKYYKLVEKYDVVHPEESGGGGEYPLQDGFGWTNGVLLALLRDRDLS